MPIPLIVYLAVINIATFVVYAVDKAAAVKHKWRIKELTLLAMAFIGGSFGALVAMYALHHKTRKARFFVSVPIMFVVQAVLLFFVMRKWW